MLLDNSRILWLYRTKLSLEIEETEGVGVFLVVSIPIV